VCPRNKKKCVRENDPEVHVRTHKEIIPPSPAAIDIFFRKVNMAKKKPAILKITQPYAQGFIPKLCSSTLPRPMMELYDPEALHMGYLSLLEACESAFQGIKVRLINNH